MKGLRVDFCPLPELYEDLEPAEAPGAHIVSSWVLMNLGDPGFGISHY